MPSCLHLQMQDSAGEAWSSTAEVLQHMEGMLACFGLGEAIAMLDSTKLVYHLMMDSMLPFITVAQVRLDCSHAGIFAMETGAFAWKKCTLTTFVLLVHHCRRRVAKQVASQRLLL
jgi:hypothetical protein